MQILDGKAVRDSLKQKLLEHIKGLLCIPTLSLIQVGDNARSNIYIKQKMAFAESIGAKVKHLRFPESVSFEELSTAIASENASADTHGIIVQLPLPDGLDKMAVIDLIDPAKDVDGLTTGATMIPATAKAVVTILDFYNIDVKGKRVAVLGRSRLVGAPVARLLAARGALVSVCHSQTPNTKEITQAADIVVVAIGKPEFVTAEYIKTGAVVIDVGINSIPVAGSNKPRIAGDVNHADVTGLVSAITPVPGGVGPVTVFSLFDNLVHAAQESCGSKRTN